MDAFYGQALSPEIPQNGPPSQPPAKPPVPAEWQHADLVMFEQLEFLSQHVNGVICGCHQCDRYLQIRELLLSAFTRN